MAETLTGAPHSPHCCSFRGCHDVCSHACGTTLEAIPICSCSDYCRERQPIVQARIAENERRDREYARRQRGHDA